MLTMGALLSQVSVCGSQASAILKDEHGVILGSLTSSVLADSCIHQIRTSNPYQSVRGTREDSSGHQSNNRPGHLYRIALPQPA
jgi:hypothetical protein